MTDRIIQVANLDPNTRRKNSNNLRVYFPKGIAACIHSGGRVEMPLVACNRTQMESKVIQITNLSHGRNRADPNNYRVYWPKGIAPCVTSGAYKGTPCPLWLIVK